MASSVVTTKLFDRLRTEVHVWFCNPSLIQGEAKLSDYKAVLSKQEVEQYHRFHFDKDRHDYLVSHALLRYTLSKYAELPASKWEFSRDKNGKPELISPSAVSGLCFNLTHTDGLSACIITLNRRCGIDAENLHRKNRLNAVAQRMFAEQERVQLDVNNMAPQFYYFWTLREAFVKALGTGLAGSSKAFYFDVDMKSLRVVMHHREISSAENKNWHFRLYQLAPEHVLALGFESNDPVRVVMNEFKS